MRLTRVAEDTALVDADADIPESMIVLDANDIIDAAPRALTIWEREP